MTQEEVKELLKNTPLTHYKKFGRFSFFVSDIEQEIVTEIDGEKEVKNIAHPGDYILVGTGGEKYVMNEKTFHKRYKALHYDTTFHKDMVVQGEAEATGECWATEWTHPSIKFQSPFKDKEGNPEEMIINEGDFLASPDEEISQGYRIERKAFLKTYKLA